MPNSPANSDPEPLPPPEIWIELPYTHYIAYACPTCGQNREFVRTRVAEYFPLKEDETPPEDPEHGVRKPKSYFYQCRKCGTSIVLEL